MAVDLQTLEARPDASGKKASAEPTVVPSPDSRILPKEFYAHFLSTISKSRKSSPIRDLFTTELQPGMLSMLAGKPDPSTFPFSSISLAIRSPNPTANAKETQLVLEGDELADGLQYNMTSGMPALNEWIAQLMAQVHGLREGEGWRVSLGPGSQDLLYKAFSALVNPGDSIMVEAPTYPGIMPIIMALNCNIVEIPSDSNGICATSLAAILESWDPKKPFPKLLYTVPFGSNPTGITTTQPRRLEVLSLARKHNFLILEDDPYYHLYYGTLPRPASYFSLERSTEGQIGRVLRFDSFSKVLAAGFRIGWITGPSPLIEPIEYHSAASVLQPASISQAIILKLVTLWGIPGFLAHTDRVASFYEKKRDAFELALHRHLNGLAEWTTPDASMFFWLKLALPPATDVENIKGDEGDSTVLIRTQALEHGVLLLPGECAYANGRKTANVRVSFSLLTEEEMNEALRRLAAVLRSV